MPAQGALRDRLGAGDGLIETLAYLPGQGAVRIDRHLARLRRSAEALGIACDVAEAGERLNELAREETPLRLRLLLKKDGTIEATAAPFALTPPEAVWRVRIAATVRLDSRDPLLAHKTTRRAVYEAARAEFATDDAQEVLLTNERGELCEGTITSIFVQRTGGMLETPPLACGLLAGVLREELLESGLAVEAVLHPADLDDRTLFVGNSLRGLVPARVA